MDLSDFVSPPPSMLIRTPTELEAAKTKELAAAKQKRWADREARRLEVGHSCALPH